ncbi:hypothetical protein O6H91_08G050100 [Diphasiastrum complanatum]|uniref:Uncharacterized protein n=1 Tax=Diphasiastrum complanatum TaxID=34168 RepID=A0ACC2CXF1_DIPCM|nr:hypothetical protein O6H91_08G050100 [Diphasiastrum complanatum]
MQQAREMAELITVDRDSRLRLLPQEVYEDSIKVGNSCASFRARVSQFHNLVKELLSQVTENAEKVEKAKLCAIGTRNMLIEEIESRPQKVKDQQGIIANKEEQIKKLKEEFESLMILKKEQDLLISWLIDPSLRPSS